MKPNVSSSTPTKLMFNCSGSSQPHSYSGSHTPPGAGSIYYTPGSGSKSSHSPPGSSPRYHSPMSSTYSSHTPNTSSGSLHYSYSSNHSSPTYWSSDSAVSVFFIFFYCFCHWYAAKLEHYIERFREYHWTHCLSYLSSVHVVPLFFLPLQVNVNKPTLISKWLDKYYECILVVTT